MLIKCDGCGKNFPFNPRKHRSDKTVYCPFCHTGQPNPDKRALTWKPNLGWLKEKLFKREERQMKKQMKAIERITHGLRRSLKREPTFEEVMRKFLFDFGEDRAKRMRWDKLREKGALIK